MSERRKVLELFEQQKDYLDEKIKSGIENNRKGRFNLKIVREHGEPVPGAQVFVNQKSHEFRFGANIFMIDEFENEEFVDKDGQPIQKGSKVIWFDSGRSARDLKRIWKVYDMGGDIVYIADDYGEAEVFPQELKVVC